ncbi:ABC transporter permease [Pseudonocardia nigra]|uniref:ABC transporter permease n=1 Tax=Pseudonocardia nigra TaxID=1921578 RepID=UPI001C5FB87B|nr:ABC transporter permease subunit [Pseudonocardia nigra]
MSLGLVVGTSRLLRDAYEPVFTTISALPLVVLYPIVAAILGVGSGSKIVIGTLYAFFPIVIATTRAAATVDTRLLAAARAMGASSAEVTRSVVSIQPDLERDLVSGSV